MAVTFHSPDILTIDEVLTPVECADWIRRGDAEGFGAAPINQTAFVPSVRNNTRAMFDDVEAAGALWPRLAEHLPSPIEGWLSYGLNERLRVYRYTPGQYFRWHADGHFARNVAERSLFTLMVYLDEPEAGGATAFRSAGRLAPGLEIVPKAGMALLFRHALIHCGRPVEAGTKHVLRTDVMYRHRTLRPDDPRWAGLTVGARMAWRRRR